jgi:hypothetical protein
VLELDAVTQLIREGLWEEIEAPNTIAGVRYVDGRARERVNGPRKRNVRGVDTGNLYARRIRKVIAFQLRSK